MNSDPEQFRSRTRTELFFDFVRARFLSVVAVGLLAGGVAIVVGVDPELPRWAQLAGLTVLLIGIPVGGFAGSWLTGVLHNPNYQYLIDLDAAYLDGAIYQLPPEDFRELTVTDEKGNPDTPYDMTQLSPNLHVAKAVDLENLTAVGTWRGTLDDRELARSLRSVRECRGQLQDDAQKGFVLETSAFTIVRRAAREATLDVVEMFQQGTLPDRGVSVNESVDAALEEFEFSQEIETTIDELTETADLNEEPAPDRDDDPLEEQSEPAREMTNGAETNDR